MSVLRPYLKSNEVAIDRDVLDEWMHKLHRVGLTLDEAQDALSIRDDIYTILSQPRWTDKQSLTVDLPPLIVTLEIPDCAGWEASGRRDGDSAWVTEFRAFGNTDNKKPATIGPIVDRTTVEGDAGVKPCSCGARKDAIEFRARYVSHDKIRYYIRCDACGKHGKNSDTREEAIAKWNAMQEGEG